jgi:hypothetical protein
VAFTGDWLADRRSSPEAEASAREQVMAVWRAAAALSERQRTVFLLRFVEQMDIREIAAESEEHGPHGADVHGGPGGQHMMPPPPHPEHD